MTQIGTVTIKPPVIGHRGVAGYAPENTLASIRAAAAMGIRWVEFDTKLTADGQIVLLHDEKLERTTDGSGRVADMTLTELRTLDAGAWFAETFRGERIPTLSEALVELDALGLGANVEIKPDPGREAETGEAVGRLLEREWPRRLPPPILSSFSTESLRAASSVLPDAPRALLVVDVPADWHQRMDALGCAALHCAGDRLAGDVATKIRAKGVGLRCYTINDAELARTLFESGVEAVFSDFPDRIPGADRIPR